MEEKRVQERVSELLAEDGSGEGRLRKLKERRGGRED